MAVPVKLTVKRQGDGRNFVSQAVEAEFQARAEEMADLGVELLKEELSVQFSEGASSVGLYLFRRTGNLVNSVRKEVTNGKVEWGVLDQGNWLEFWTDPARGDKRRKGLEEFMEENFEKFDAIMQDENPRTTEGKTFVDRLTSSVKRFFGRFFRND